MRTPRGSPRRIERARASSRSPAASPPRAARLGRRGCRDPGRGAPSARARGRAPATSSLDVRRCRSLVGARGEGVNDSPSTQAETRASDPHDAPPSQEAREQVVTGLGEDGLGVELHAHHGERAVAHGHDLALLARGRDLQHVGDALGVEHERVVARGAKRVGQTGEDAPSVVRHGRGPAVERTLRARDATAEHLPDAEVPEAHAEDGDPLGEALDDGVRDPRVVRRARSRREDDVRRRPRGDAVERHVVAAHDLALVAQLADVAGEVVARTSRGCRSGGSCGHALAAGGASGARAPCRASRRTRRAGPSRRRSRPRRGTRPPRPGTSWSGWRCSCPSRRRSRSTRCCRSTVRGARARARRGSPWRGSSARP